MAVASSSVLLCSRRLLGTFTLALLYLALAGVDVLPVTLHGCRQFLGAPLFSVPLPLPFCILPLLVLTYSLQAVGFICASMDPDMSCVITSCSSIKNSESTV